MEKIEVGLEDIIYAAKEVFCDGIYFEWDDHPCGWDFLSFDNIESVEEAKDYIIDSRDISNGVYTHHDLEDKKLLDALRDSIKSFWFEVGQIGAYKRYVWSGK